MRDSWISNRTLINIKSFCKLYSSKGTKQREKDKVKRGKTKEKKTRLKGAKQRGKRLKGAFEFRFGSANSGFCCDRIFRLKNPIVTELCSLLLFTVTVLLHFRSNFCFFPAEQ